MIVFYVLRLPSPTAVEVILVPAVILASFRLYKRQGSHVREITSDTTALLSALLEADFFSNKATFFVF